MKPGIYYSAQNDELLIIHGAGNTLGTMIVEMKYGQLPMRIDVLKTLGFKRLFAL